MHADGQAGVVDGPARFEEPEKRGVEEEAGYVRFGAEDAEPVFFALGGEKGALGVGHGVVG